MALHPHLVKVSGTDGDFTTDISDSAKEISEILVKLSQLGSDVFCSNEEPDGHVVSFTSFEDIHYCRMLIAHWLHSIKHALEGTLYWDAAKDKVHVIVWCKDGIFRCTLDGRVWDQNAFPTEEMLY